MQRVVIFIFFLHTLLLANSLKIEKLQKVTLQLHGKYQFEFAGFIAAKEKGFYEDAGLDVAIKEYEQGMNIEEEVLSGKATYATYNSFAFLEYLRAKPLILLSSYFKRPALVLVVKPEIKSPKDLIGKTVATTTKEDFKLNFTFYLKRYGLSVDDLKLLPQSHQIDNFIKDNVAGMTIMMNKLYQLDEKSIKYNTLNLSDDYPFVLQLELISSQKEVKKYPKRSKAFRDASLKGWKYALAHKDEMAKIISRKYQKYSLQNEILKEAVGVERSMLPNTYELGSIDENFLKKQMELFRREYGIKNKKKLEGFIFKPKSQYMNIQFSDKERAYIAKHKRIKLCINYDLFPIDGVKNGKISGEMADIFSLISQKTTIEFLPVRTISENDLKQKVLDKQCQLLAIVANKNKEFTSLKLTKPFSSMSFALLRKIENSFIDDPMLLKDKTLVVQKESFKRYLKHLYPYLRIKVEEDKNKMVRDLLYNQVFGIVTLDEQADYFIEKYGYGKLKISGFLAKEYPIKERVGVQKDEMILFELIDKVLAQIPREQIASIRNSWRISRYQITIDYSLAIKILLFMSTVLLIMTYYQRKLKNFNKELEHQVNEKTKELREINESLEVTVQDKIKELIQKDEILTAQSKQAVMGEMISMIAHQWRQPLNTITLQISNIQLKEMIGNGVQKEEMLHILNEISNSIVYLSNTIDDFKTYFHPDKKLSQIIIGELLEKAVGFIEPRVIRNSIEIRLEGDLKAEIHVYANELIQVILNIMNNAIDAYENAGLKDKEIVISVETKLQRVIITIYDSAGGISQAHIKKIFEPYFSTKGKNGTGLGLYMSKMIIEKQFNGSIRVDSRDNRTTFYIEIPKRVRS